MTAQGPDAPFNPGRRDALKAFSAGAAALVAGCRPQAELLPYREMPEGKAAGMPMFFATVLPLGGAGRGVVVESHQGRPTKIHGNALHPASLGGTDVFAEAELLGLFDPARLPSPERDGVPVTWSGVEEALRRAVGDTGAGVALVTGPVGSPTLARQLGALSAAKPDLRHYLHQPVTPELVARHGPRPDEAVQLWPDFDALDVIVTLGADPLGPGPGQVAFAKGWSRAKRARRGAVQLHAFEATASLTGSQATRRHAVSPRHYPSLADALLHGGGGAEVERAARALKDNAGRAAVFGAPDLPAAVQGKIAALNAEIGAPIARLRPFWSWTGLAPAGEAELMADLTAGRISTLVILGANPAYSLPGFAEAMSNAAQTIAFSTAPNETTSLADLRAPLHHPLEDWSDLRALDGSVALGQPLIAPLFDSRSAHEVVSALEGRFNTGARDIVAATWQAEWGEGFEDRWRQALVDGIIDGTGAQEATAPAFAADDPVPAPQPQAPFALDLRPSAAVYDGAHAGNAWLQECPEPFTKQVWGNAAILAPADAEQMGIAEGDMVRLASGEHGAELPATLVSSQAPGTVGVALGYGRPEAGPVGSGVGAAAYGLGPAVSVRRTGDRGVVLRTQGEFGQHDRDILKTVPAGKPELHAHTEHASFYKDWEYNSYAWGMVIDTDVCIGCNACVISCQSENNVSVVGPEEIAKGRYMHWMRVDAYDGEAHATRAFQPVPCQHCEKAPCEPMCPVGAAVHDAEGLNVQVYNRCIGTRFCAANCPYQVRRFNFFDYADGQAYAHLGHDLLQALRNPDVSVRGRGVMEKCTYCVQRISNARRDAKAENRTIEEGEVVTACQAACPTEAITFGDISDEGSAVSEARSDPRHYRLLEHLGTEPRTTYLAKVVPGGGDHGEGGA